LGAGIIDFILIVVISALSMAVVGASLDTLNESVSTSAALTAFAIPAIYRLLCQLVWRATPGKLMLGLKVVSDGGEEATHGQVLGREFLFILLWVVPIVNLIWLIMLAGDTKKQGWHDKAASTVVVRAR
jgi:uncharacterized RDD family membrane protein YckC